MRIAIITRFKHFTGGVESVTKILKKIFEEANFGVDIISVEDACLGIPHWVMKNIHGLLYPVIVSIYFNRIQAKYDLVICNGEFGFNIRHKNSIVLFHGSYLGYRNYLQKYLSFRQYLSLSFCVYVQQLAARGKYVICVSNFIKGILNQQKINVDEVICNSIDTDFFVQDSVSSRMNKCLFVGSYDYFGKGFDLLEQLSIAGINIDVVTDKDPGSKMGWIKSGTNNFMPEIYNKYKFLVFPSRFEGMQMVPLEAMACGLPVIISSVGLGEDLIEFIPEFVFDFTRPDFIPLFFDRLSLIDSNYEFFSMKAREYVLKQHSYMTFKNKWLDVISRRFEYVNLQSKKNAVL